MLEGLFYVFDLENTQDHYAKCMRFIELLEHLNTTGSPTEQLKEINDLVNLISVRGAANTGRLPAKNYFESPIVYLNNPNETVPLINTAKKLCLGRVRPDILNYAGKNTYHIRVHFSRTPDGRITDIMNLRYLALLLQRFDVLINERTPANSRISVFAVPSSGDAYPFQDPTGNTDFGTYSTVSAYLRLLSKKYTGIIYGVVNHKDVATVRSLNFRTVMRFDVDFPLTLIDADTYRKLFDEPVTSEDLQAFLSLRKHCRFRDAKSDNPIAAFTDYLLEASFSALKHSCSSFDKKHSKQLEERILSLFSPNNPENDPLPSLLSTAIFSFTFCSIPVPSGTQLSLDHLTSHIRTCMQRALDLAEGIRQIAQNALQYAQTKSCVFAFSIQKSEDAGQTIQIALCDYNGKNDLTETFVRSLEQERTLAEEEQELDKIAIYDSLLKLRSELSLRNFFQDYGKKNQLQGAWERFRSSDIFAHVGLLLFSCAVRRYRGILHVSSQTHTAMEEDNAYFYDFSAPDSSSPQTQAEYRIPGTQFKIGIPCTWTSDVDTESILGLAQLNHIHEGYYEFARHLSMGTEHCRFCPDAYAPQRVYISASQKQNAVYSWRNRWLASVEEARDLAATSPESTIFYWDMKHQDSRLPEKADDFEVFWKGFVSALDVLEKKGFRYLAITNLNPMQVRVFRMLCRTYIHKAFPTSIQVYLSQTMEFPAPGSQVMQNKAVAFHLTGSTYAQAIQNAYCLCVERGTQSFDNHDMESVHALTATSWKDTILGSPQEISLCPFDVILPCELDSRETLFDRQISLMAENPIDQPPFGNKISDTHMQLGSKVHIRAFYEMAYLFYRTSIANRIAFEILRELKDRNCADLLKDRFLFYGYASYSKALLTSIREILKFYRECNLYMPRENAVPLTPRKEAGQTLAIATFQHNLQSEARLPTPETHGDTNAFAKTQSVEKSQLYFDFPEVSDNGETCERDFFKPGVKLVQIVPISSTLTTFEKMYARLQRELKDKFSISPEAQTQLCANFTAFWVTDASTDIQAGELSEIEKNYIEASCANQIHQNRYVITKLKGMKDNPGIYYLMLARAVWDPPLQCKKCYPNNVIMEVPLVSVDQTSTVPTQQIRTQYLSYDDSFPNEVNNQRLLLLKDCIWKGHFLREKNHFHYYIDTQKFFTVARDDVADWLHAMTQEPSSQQTAPLNIIFSPEHTTNIGFAQYVNNYYFKGNAEIVCLNEDKEFRSNFCCEHMALQQAIRQVFSLYSKNRDFYGQPLPVRFHFVDDTIISGSTFFKANSFLHSLLPQDIRASYPTNLIDHCFVLVDRLSNASKQNYVKDVKNNFHSFVHLDISNERIQGDSCTGCKHVQNAVYLFKRSSTRLRAEHWFQEINNNAICSYDDESTYSYTASRNASWADPGNKALLSHIAQNVIFKANDAFSLGAIYDSVLAILSKLLQPQKAPLLVKQFEYQTLADAITQSISPEQAAVELLNLISRPFFSYDFKCRLQVQTILLIFTECLLNGSDNTLDGLLAQMQQTDEEIHSKAFLLENCRIQDTITIYRVLEKKLIKTGKLHQFLDTCLFSSLAEMQSTYLLRKKTFQSIYRFIKDKNRCPSEEVGRFLEHYASHIHYLLDSGANETRALWLEHFLITGEEYSAVLKPRQPEDWKSLYQTVTGMQPCCANADLPDTLFKRFCDEVFLQNVSTIRDGVENQVTNPAYDDTNAIEHWKDFRIADGVSSQLLPSEVALYSTLMDYTKKADPEMTVNKKYDQILEKIQNVAQEKYKFQDIHLAILTCSEPEDPHDKEEMDIRQLDFVASGKQVPISDSWTRYRIKYNLFSALQKEQGGTSPLLQYGYQLSCGVMEKSSSADPYLFVYFDNPEGAIAPSVTASVGSSVGREIKRIVKVFLYFSSSASKEEPQQKYNLKLRLFLRDILTYRHQIMKILENDFAGDIFAKYAHTSSERNILAHEKVNSHNTSSDDRASLGVLAFPKTAENYDILDSAQVVKWLLLRNYTNGQIAKLFNRSFSRRDEDSLFDRGDNIQAPPLYISMENAVSRSSSPDRPLISFHQLDILDDARFALLEQAVSIEFSPNLENAYFLCNEKGEYYNAEYMKCILIDSLFSAMKYCSDQETFLPRLDHCLKKMHYSRHLSKNEYSPAYEVQACKVILSRAPAEEWDYLVIENNVDYAAHNLFDLNARNQQIVAHLSSPTDFFDGHMSLLAIKEYIEGIHEKERKERYRALFEYQEDHDQNGEKIVKFVSKLPILKKQMEDDANGSMLD